MTLKLAKRLQRSCNRPDVRLYHNRIWLPYHSELVGSDTGRIKVPESNKMKPYEFTNTKKKAKLIRKIRDDGRAKQEPHKMASLAFEA